MSPWGERGSDIATVTVSLQSPPEPDMAFITAKPERPSYFEGEGVVLTITVKNNGESGDFFMECYDMDTGEYIGGFGSYLEGGMIRPTVFHLPTMMPNRDWRLRLEITP